MQCNAMQCNAMQCNAMQCNAMWSELIVLHTSLSASQQLQLIANQILRSIAAIGNIFIRRLIRTKCINWPRDQLLFLVLTRAPWKLSNPTKSQTPNSLNFGSKKFEESQFWPDLQSHTPLVLEFLSSVPVSLKASRHLLDHKVPGNTLVPGVPARRRRWRWKEGGGPCGRGSPRRNCRMGGGRGERELVPLSAQL